MDLDIQKGRFNRFNIIFTSLVFCIYFYLAYRTPLTHDDWAWGSSIGMDWLKSGFENYNGRYLGNLTEMLLTRTYWIRFLVMALFSTALVVLSAKMTQVTTKFSYIVSFFLFLTIPVNMLSQTYSWVAGFSNYITSIVLILIYLNIVKNIFGNETPTYNKWMAIAVFPLGVATQLFVEHVTLYAVVMSLAIIFYSYIKFKKVFLVHLSYFSSVVIGAIILFSNGAYSKILSGGDGYRSIGESSESAGLFSNIIDVYTNQMYPLLFMNNLFLNILISVGCILLIVKIKNKTNKVTAILSNMLLVIFVTFPMYTIITNGIIKSSLFFENNNIFEAVFSLIFYLSIILTVFLFIEDKNIKHKMYFYLISIIVLAAPLIFVKPFGPRNFITSFAFFVLFIIELGSYLKSKGLLEFNIVNKLLLIASISYSAVYLYIFSVIGIVDNERMDYINKQIQLGQKEIILTQLPYEEFLWLGTPKLESSQYSAFKLFYNVPEDVNFEIIPHSEWEQLKENDDLTK